MSQSRVVIAINADAKALPPLIRVIEKYMTKAQPVLLVCRASALFRAARLAVSEKVETKIIGISKNRYVRLTEYCRFIQEVLRAAMAAETKQVVLIDPPTRLIGVLLSWFSRVPITYWEFDESPISSTFRSTAIEWFMKILGKRAHAVVVPNLSRKSRFVERYKPTCPVEVLSNHPLRSEFLLSEELRPIVSGQTLRLYYHGSFVKERMPISLVQAMVIEPHFNLVITPVIPDVQGGGEWLNSFLSEAKRKGVSERIQQHDFLNIDELGPLGSSCHVGIGFYGYNGSNNTNLAFMWGASNKLGQYAAYGLAILCSTNEKEMRDSLECGAKFCDMEDPESIAVAIGQWIKDPELLNRMRGEMHAKALREWTLEAALEDQGIQRAMGMS